jgi:hypothetical protein
VLAENADMARLMLSRGAQPERDEEDPTVVRFVKTL